MSFFTYSIPFERNCSMAFSKESVPGKAVWNKSDGRRVWKEILGGEL
jgi:hypothetical protein